MAKEQIADPKMEKIKKNQDYVLREMMMQALNTKNVRDGLNISFSLLRTFLCSDNVIIFKKMKNGMYEKVISDSEIDDSSLFPLSCMTNKNAIFTEHEKVYEEKLNEHISQRYKNIINIHNKIEDEEHSIGDKEYITIIVNPNCKDIDPDFWDELRDTLKIILKRAASYDTNMKRATMDLKFDVDNRNSYELTIQKMDNNMDDLSLAIFDLYRLKYINDKYSHSLGDEYIKKAASILKKWWPKSISEKDLIDKIECVFRYGGDEFVILDNLENYYLNLQKAEHAQREFSYFRLPGAEEVPIGFNYGIVKHNPGDSFKETFDRADILMQEDKKQMYLKNGHERRGHIL